MVDDYAAVRCPRKASVHRLLASLQIEQSQTVSNPSATRYHSHMSFAMPAPEGFHFRLLCPCHFKEPPDLQALARLAFPRTGSSPLPIWSTSALPAAYTEEHFRETSRSFFEKGFAYFAVDHACLQIWFSDVTAVMLDGRAEQTWRKHADAHSERGDRPLSVPLSLAHDFGIELFLWQDQRLGLLSIAFKEPVRFPGKGLGGVAPAFHTLSQIQAIQYHGSHTKYRAPVFRTPAFSTDPHLASPLGGESVTELNPSESPLLHRLGQRGQPFFLSELRDLLFSPIQSSLQYFEQTQFLIHSTVRFGTEVDFSDDRLLAVMAPQAAAIAQIEEPRHAPHLVDHIGVPYAVLNSKHIAAYSYLGSAHLVADQWSAAESDQSFDASRVSRVQSKYFSAFLITLVQRLVAHRFLEQSTDLPENGMCALWAQFAEFESQAHLIDVSRRESVNRCYRLALEAQRIPDVTAHLHRIFRDRQSEAQIRRLRSLGEEQRETQRHLGLIEIFIVTVYTIELANILAENGHFVPLYRFAGVILAGLLALATVIQHHRASPERARPKQSNWPTVILLSLSILALGTWVAAGFWKFHANPQPSVESRTGAATLPPAPDKPPSQIPPAPQLPPTGQPPAKPDNPQPAPHN